jgi:hypothetical protein
LLLIKIITATTLGAHKIQRLTLNQPLIALTAMKILHVQHSQQGMFSLEKKALGLFLFFLISPKKQKTEHQSESNSVSS